MGILMIVIGMLIGININNRIARKAENLNEQINRKVIPVNSRQASDSLNTVEFYSKDRQKKVERFEPKSISLESLNDIMFNFFPI